MKNVEASFDDLINQYHVDMLAIKKLHPSRSSRNLDDLVRGIKRLAKRKEIKVCCYSLPELKESFGLGAAQANKMAIASIVAARYPFLCREFEREKKHKHPYFIRMFEAIAAGMVTYSRAKHRQG